MPAADPPIPSDAKQLSVVMPSWVGDAVMATPALRAIRHHRPDLRLHLVVRPGLEQVLAGLPFVDTVEVCHMKGALGPLRLGRAIRAPFRGQSPEAVLLLPNSFRSGLGCRLSSCPRRIGYDRDFRGWLLTHSIPPGRHDAPTPAVDYYRDLTAFALGDDLAETFDPQPELATTPAEAAQADELLGDVPGEFILLNPGANRTDKRWPPRNFAALADALIERRGVTIAITGSPGERDVLDQVQSAASHDLLDLAQRGVTLGSLKAVIRRASLLITNDTGPRHLAAALGTPGVVLFGPTDHRWTTLHGPRIREHLLLAQPFLPEDRVADDYAKACAIDRIPVRDALAAAEAMLDERTSPT